MKVKSICTLGLACLTSITAVACNTNKQSTEATTTGVQPEVTTTQSPAAPDKSGGATKHIDAAYMRTHIFDYKANPNKFVFKGSRPAILDFYADWCGPCRKIAPYLEAIAKKYEGKLDVYKINVDNEEELAQVFGVRSIPMLLFIDTDGSTPSVVQGALSQEALEKEAERLVK